MTQISAIHFLISSKDEVEEGWISRWLLMPWSYYRSFESLFRENWLYENQRDDGNRDGHDQSVCRAKDE